MKEIKEIDPTDAVWCWVGDTQEELVDRRNKRLVIGKIGTKYITVFDKQEKQFLEGNSCDVTTYKKAIQYEETSKWQDKYNHLHTLDAKIFSALRDGAILKNNNRNPTINNYWATHMIKSQYKICLNYTGQDTDIFEELEY